MVFLNTVYRYRSYHNFLIIFLVLLLTNRARITFTKTTTFSLFIFNNDFTFLRTRFEKQKIIFVIFVIAKIV